MIENRAMSNSDLTAPSGSKPEPAANSDKQPNLTLLEPGQNPGAMLRSARERAGMTLADISAQTKINERQLQAIESGDTAKLPPETFAKAFIKSYCKVLKMDPTPVILAYGLSETVAAVRAAPVVSEHAVRGDVSEARMPSTSRRLSSLSFDRKPGKSLGYGIVLGALVLMAVFYLPVFLSGKSKETAETVESSPPAVEQAAPSVPTPAPAEPAAASPATTSEPASAAVFPALQQPSAPVPAPAQGTGTPTAPAASAPAPVAAVTPATPAAPVAAQPSNPTATASGQPAASAKPAAPAPVSAAEATLRFNFSEQSWVTVRDADDQVLVSQLNAGGSSLDVKGKGPFKLIVGNAKAVRVFNNGQYIDLGPSIRGEVARLTVQ